MEHLYSLFVEHHSEVLIQMVKSVMPIADALRDDKTIPLETHSLILEASADAKMTVLTFTSSDHHQSKIFFFNVLQAREPNLVEELQHQERARLADFGLSRKLEEGKTTVYTDRAGTQGWEATEIVNQTENSHYKSSTDIQVAGMLTYYILSDGKHPFGDGIFREVNISEGKYFLGDIQDIAAKDVKEWMINKKQDKRPTVDKVLDHPYFWDDKHEEQFYEEKMIDEFPDFFISLHKLAIDMGWEY